MIQRNWKELIKPEKLEINAEDPKRKATVVAEPLERGFGMTLGNALRRVLLSSLQGAAVTAIHIDNVLHEFSSIEGVREDVTDIVLNVKQLAIAMHGEGPKRITLRATGPGAVTAGQIETGHDIDVLNPDLVLMHLDDGASINIEMTVNNGKGYVPASANRPEDAPIGLIPVDALYSPIRKVAYRVENTREGQVLDYDKLSMDILTNGAVSPEDAVAYAARILQDQLQLFINFEEPKLRSPARGDVRGDSGVQPQSPAQGGRTGIVGAVGQLPEERQHRLHRRSDPEDRGGNAAHAELRPQVAERDQGSARSTMGLTPWYGESPGWPPENIEDLAKRLEEPLLRPTSESDFGFEDTVSRSDAASQHGAVAN